MDRDPPGGNNRSMCPVDLAEALGVRPQDVLKACKELGIRGIRAAVDIPAGEVDRVVRKLRGRGAVPPQPAPPPRPPPLAPTPALVVPTATPPEPRQTESAAYYKRKHDAALARVRELEAQVAELQAAIQHQPKKPRPSAALPARTAPAPMSLAAWLDDRGFGDEAMVPALRALLSRAGIAPKLLQTLTVNDARALRPLVERYLLRACEHEGCRAVAQHRGVDCVDAPAARCGICQGSANRRAVTWMAIACEQASAGAIVIVGGSPQTHAELRELSGDQPVALTLIDGKRDPPIGTARLDIAKKNLVVIWSGTILNHATSEVYKQACDREGVPFIYAPRRGVGSLADTVREHLSRP